MKKMLEWLTRFIWISEVIFLAASTPHIATYFAHFDNPGDPVSFVYAWGVGYGLALLIDGISFIVLMSMMFSIKYHRPRWLVAFLVFAMVLVSTLSWFINWQYNVVFASTTFAEADKIQVSVLAFNTTVGNLNPLIGGAFPLLSVLYALVAKAIEVDEGEVNREAMSPEQFEMEKLRIAQEQELKALRNAQRSGKGLLSIAQETVMGQSTNADELLNRTLSFLRDARNLCDIDQEEYALEALSAYLKMRVKAVQPLLIQARSIIEREEHEESERLAKLEQEERLRQAKAEQDARIAREQAEREESMRRAKAEEEERLKREQTEREDRIRREQAEHEALLERVRLEHEERLARLQAEQEERIRLAKLAEEERTRQAKLEEEARLKQEREAEEERLRVEQEAKEERLKQARIRKEEQQQAVSGDGDVLKGLKGTDTVSLEVAAQALGHEDTRYVVRLRNDETLKHRPNREDLITVASLRAYLAKHPKRTTTPLLTAVRTDDVDHVEQQESVEAIA
jgi:hypothetical protein